MSNCNASAYFYSFFFVPLRILVTRVNIKMQQAGRGASITAPAKPYGLITNHVCGRDASTTASAYDTHGNPQLYRSDNSLDYNIAYGHTDSRLFSEIDVLRYCAFSH